MTTGDSSASAQPTSDIYVYYPYTPSSGTTAGQWGEPVLVDGNGDPIKCPPAYTVSTDSSGKPVVTLLTGDNLAQTKITPPTYTAPAGQEMYVYYPVTVMSGAGAGTEWGEPVLVDGNGDPIKCPPAYVVSTDAGGKPVVTLLAGDEGKYTGITPPTYVPPGTPPPSATEEEEEEEGEGLPGEVLDIEAGAPADETAAAPAFEQLAAEPGEGVGPSEDAEEAPEPEPLAPGPAEGVGVIGLIAEEIPAAPEPAETAEVIGLTAQEIPAAPEPVETAEVIGLLAEEIAIPPAPTAEPVEIAEVADLAAPAVEPLQVKIPGETDWKVTPAEAEPVAFEVERDVSGEPADFTTETLEAGSSQEEGTAGVGEVEP